MEVAEEGSGDARGREGCCEPAVGRGRTAWDEVEYMPRVAEEGSDARGKGGLLLTSCW